MEKRGRGRPKKQTFETLREERRELYNPKKTKDGWLVGGRKVPACNFLTALLFGFKEAGSPDEKEHLFWEIANLLWNKDAENPKFAKHKWAWKLIREYCREKYVGVGGAGSSSKSYTSAGWGIVNWLADPANTLVLMTSTDLGGARARIWGAMSRLLNEVPDPPCKIRDAIGVVAYFDGKTAFSTAGIKLVSADKNKERIGKLIGIKSPTVILVADEIGEMSTNVQEAAVGNLSKNPNFQMIGLSNPASRFDAFGVFCTPKNGWDSINTELDYEWRMKVGGLYIRLDSEQSPNIDTEPNPEYPSDQFYPYLPTTEQIEEALNNLGTTPEEARKSRAFRRFNAATFFDGADDENVYSEGDFTKAGALDNVKISNPTLIAGCDPSYSNGGDRTVMVLVEEGFDPRTQHSVQFKKMVYLYEDSTSQIPRTHQIAQKIIDTCNLWGVKPENFGLDASSGSGKGLADVVQDLWGNNSFLRVEFGGKASSKRIKNDSKVLGHERYANRASELYFCGLHFLLGRQWYGIPPIIAKQFCQRAVLPPTKGPNGIRLQVEPKKLLKARVGQSPDEQDAFLVAVEVARTRHMFTPADPIRVDVEDVSSYLRGRRTLNTYAANNLGFVGNL